jgi:5-methylcytosine-specific restriction endonuclease McrA
MSQRRRQYRKPWEGTGINSGGGSWKWSKLVRQVIAEEPWCRLRLPGCRMVSETADHIIPKCYRPDLAMHRPNLRGSCHHCNRRRGNRPLETVRAEMRHLYRPRRRAKALDFFGERR